MKLEDAIKKYPDSKMLALIDALIGGENSCLMEYAICEQGMSYPKAKLTEIALAVQNNAILGIEEHTHTTMYDHDGVLKWDSHMTVDELEEAYGEKYGRPIELIQIKSAPEFGRCYSGHTDVYLIIRK